MDIFTTKTKAPPGALHDAIYAGNTALVKQLIKTSDVNLPCPIRPNAPNDDVLAKQLPLHIAIQQGDYDIISLLATHNKIDLNAKGPDQFTALFLTCGFARTPEKVEILFNVLKLLVAQGADTEILGPDKTSLVMQATSWNRYDALKFLLTEVEMDPNLISSNLKTALHISCSTGSPECTSVLLDADADLIPDSSGKTPLEYVTHLLESNNVLKAKRTRMEQCKKILEQHIVRVKSRNSDREKLKPAGYVSPFALPRFVDNSDSATHTSGAHSLGRKTSPRKPPSPRRTRLWSHGKGKLSSILKIRSSKQHFPQASVESRRRASFSVQDGHKRPLKYGYKRNSHDGYDSAPNISMASSIETLKLSESSPNLSNNPSIWNSRQRSSSSVHRRPNDPTKINSHQLPPPGPTFTSSQTDSHTLSNSPLHSDPILDDPDSKSRRPSSTGEKDAESTFSVDSYNLKHRSCDLSLLSRSSPLSGRSSQSPSSPLNRLSPASPILHFDNDLTVSNAFVEASQIHSHLDSHHTKSTIRPIPITFTQAESSLPSSPKSEQYTPPQPELIDDPDLEVPPLPEPMESHPLHHSVSSVSPSVSTPSPPGKLKKVKTLPMISFALDTDRPLSQQFLALEKMLQLRRRSGVPEIARNSTLDVWPEMNAILDQLDSDDDSALSSAPSTPPLPTPSNAT